MFYVLVLIVHVIVCIVLIAVILLQAGRGGGLSETFGGDSSQTIFGTKMSVFLTRATVVAAGLFLITCLLLGIMTSRRGRSLIELQPRQAVPPPLAVPYEPQPEPGAETQQPSKEGAPLAEPENPTQEE